MNTRTKTLLALAFLTIAITPLMAQGGNSAIANASTTIADYWDPIKKLLNAVGGVVGLIGGLRIYNKWTNGDQDINKEILGYGGAMVFLIIVPQFVSAFFKIA
nr:DUF4134 family protein [Vaginella massiliensis]